MYSTGGVGGVPIAPNNPMNATNAAPTSRMMRSEEPGPLLPENYEPTDLDVCSGRGKRNWNHVGNVAFRNRIQSQVEAYMASRSKNEKTAIVLAILEDMRNQGYSFLKYAKEGRWYDMGDAQARDKIGHGLRDQVTAINRQNREQQQQRPHPHHVRHPSITMSDSGNEAEHRKSTVNTAQIFENFARRPSWVAGESSSSSEMVEGTPLPMMPAPVGFEAERKRSSWDFLDNFDYCIDNGLDPMMMQSNNSVIDTSGAAAVRVSDDSSRFVMDPRQQQQQQQQQQHFYHNHPRNHLMMPNRFPDEADFQQQRQRTRTSSSNSAMDIGGGGVDNKSDLMKGSIMSFDPRISGASSVFMSGGTSQQQQQMGNNSATARMSTTFAPTTAAQQQQHPFPRERSSGSSGKSMRMSGGSTLRQATNSLRVSDMTDFALNFSDLEQSERSL